MSNIFSKFALIEIFWVFNFTFLTLLYFLGVLLLQNTVLLI